MQVWNLPSSLHFSFYIVAILFQVFAYISLFFIVLSIVTFSLLTIDEVNFKTADQTKEANITTPSIGKF